MCGIAGVWGPIEGRGSEIVGKMSQAMRHRGPDDQGTWSDESADLFLSHRRLSILDISPEGHQPMISASGRYIIVFNGEVYNFEELRAQLPGPWRGHSDTEVMLACFEAWGIEASVSKFVGMFAFALWDRYNRELYLVRDRLGIKPLYYGRVGRALVFASELKAFSVCPGFGATIDTGAIALLMRYNYVPHPYCIFEEVRKLPPGHILRVKSDRELTTPRAFWDARLVAENAHTQMLPEDPNLVLEECYRLLLDAVRLRMISDVPIGAFLSGGIDSSVVVALMQAQSNRPIRTFSIGFAEAAYNEAPFAERVATHLGTDHTEFMVTPHDAQSAIPRMPEFFDEPFADSSQVPTFLVSSLARKHVTVSLSGDGGDELFAGYPRYHITNQLWALQRLIPTPLRRLVAGTLKSVSADSWARMFQLVSSILPASVNRRRPGDQVHRLADLLNQDSAINLYKRISSHWDTTESLVNDSREPSTVFSIQDRRAVSSDFTKQMMLMDMLSYLPDDILTKVDRASMAVSLEARVPLLDHRLAEFAFRIPISIHVRNNQPKWLLKQILYKHVSRGLVDRPKMGFAMPIGDWLRGPLREWAESLLSRERLAQEGFFNVSIVRSCWEKHLSGARNFQYQLWNLLMFQAWHSAQRSRSTQAGSAA